MTTRQIAYIDENDCIGCAICINACPFDAIIGAQNFSHRINYNECPSCKICIKKCPTDCIKMVKIHQNKNDIREKVKYNFSRKELRIKNNQEIYSKSISEQISKLLSS